MITIQKPWLFLFLLFGFLFGLFFLCCFFPASATATCLAPNAHLTAKAPLKMGHREKSYLETETQNGILVKDVKEELKGK